MGKTKSFAMEFYEYSDDEINEQIHLKMSVIHQQYIDEYEKDIHREILIKEDNGNKS